MVFGEIQITKSLLLLMQNKIAKNSFDRIFIFFSYLVTHELRFKMIPVAKNLFRNICFGGLNVSMSDRNRRFQTNYWCITMCTFLLQNGVLWDICLMRCGICEMGLLKGTQVFVFSSKPKMCCACVNHYIQWMWGWSSPSLSLFSQGMIRYYFQFNVYVRCKHYTRAFFIAI